MTGPRIEQGPSLAPSGVIQNPGIGEIFGQGLSNLAQFLNQQQQQNQQQQNFQQQMGMQQQQQASTQAVQAAQVAESQQRLAQQQLAQKQAAEEALRKASVVSNFKEYLTPGPDGKAPAEQDMSPAQVESYRRAYAIDPDGTSQHLQALMAGAPVKYAKGDIGVSPLTGKTVVTNAGPLDVGTDFTAHQQGLGYGNIPLDKLTTEQNNQILAAMQKTKAAGAQKTVVQLGENAMAGAMGPLLAKNIEARYNSATNAAKDIGIATHALGLMNTGPVGAGALLPASQTLAATLQSMGLDPDPKSVRTAQIIKDLASRVIPIAREMTQGGGGGSAGRLMSNEVELAKLAAGNLRSTSPQAIKNLLEDAVTTNTYAIGQYNAWLKSQNPDQYVPGANTNLTVKPSDFMPPPPDAPNNQTGTGKAALYQGWGIH